MFEVGKKIICVKTHSQGVVKRGQVFELLAIKKNKCCGNVSFDIGIPSATVNSMCRMCYTTYVNNGTMWVCHTLFAPYDDSLSELTTSDILEEILIH